MSRKTVIFDFDKTLVPGDTKAEFAKYVYKKGAKNGLAVFAYGLMTYYHLGRANVLEAKGRREEAEAAAEKAYGWYDRILRGLSKEHVAAFAKSYSKNFSGEAKDALPEFRARGHRLYLVSGGIQECVESILKESGVYELFDGIYCNPLVTGADGKIERLEKKTSTPGKKVSVLKENDVEPKSAVAVGNGDFWDKTMFEECAHPIARSYRDGFRGLVEAIEKI